MALSHKDGGLRDAPSPGIDLQAALDASAVPALMIDPAKTIIVYANPAFAALAGHERSALAGRDVHLLLGSNSDKDARTAFAAALAGDRPEGIEVLAWRRNGSTFWAEIFAVRLADAGLVLVQMVDVTRRRDAEGALALSRQREALGLLTNSVAHEFNNFLQILIGYIDGLKRRLSDREEPFIQRAVTRSTDAAERATVLTRQLLTFSRRIAPDVRPVDMNALITAFGVRMRATLPPGVALTIRTASDLPNGLSNPTQVDLALSHILANACEAMPRGGTVEIASFLVPPGDPAIRRPGDGAVGISVHDTGHGMSPEMAARALAPFITTREAGRGTGLAIVHGLVKRQNGTVALDSKPGEGTTVRMIFPAAG
ncbi:ATP-binding protein [Methylobacterium marchantiae]|uniref:histidine kinase n=1 Tax=Methylobacterium marchantiae TaxID=600331 RepID=A0ABW3X1P9_9HYPH|nr:Blue-light-activated protein [Methylobacterium marchantiae]